MSTDLGLDPSDPLNLLLHNSSQNADSSTSSESSQMDSSHSEDWSKFSALWAEVSEQSNNPMKPYADIMDFADLNSMPMNMDFNPSMSIEPSALHYDSMKFANSGMNFSYDDQYGLSSELLASQFPFTFQFNGEDMSSSSSSASPQSSTKERRLSITSSSSSSGASLSPVPESIPSPPTYNDMVQESTQYPEAAATSFSDPAAELAQRVRQSAGVMLAVPMNAQFQGQGVQLSAANASQSKLPIPRLPRHNSTTAKPTASTSSSAASTPPPSTPPPANAFKLSLNTATMALALPEAASTPVATTPAGSLPRPKTSHTTIERRYRTNLNARIQSLRMAVPALRVLEDREGGNGKKIKKNVKGSVPIKGTTSGIIDSEDGSVVDVIDERGFVDGVKVARKCSKANVLGKAVEYIRVLKKREQRLKAEQAGLKMLVAGLVGGPALDGNPAPEKRKRGRPRKVLPPPVTLAPTLSSQESSSSMQDEVMHPPLPAVPQQSWVPQQSQPQQFLLAVFALFSFFNSPLTSSSSASSSAGHHHTGMVLSSHPPLAYAPEILSLFPEPKASGVTPWAWKEYVQIVHLVVSLLVLASFVGSWLGAGKAVARGRRMSFRVAKGAKAGPVGWFSIGEASVLEGRAASLTFYERLQIYRSISAWTNATTSQLVTISVAVQHTPGVLGGIARMKARAIWAAAKAQAQNRLPIRKYESLVFRELDLDGASALLSTATTGDKSDGERAFAPVEVLACLVIKDRIKKHLGRLFVNVVSAEDVVLEDESKEKEKEKEEREWRRTIDAARELGGRVSVLGTMFERVWKASPSALEDAELELGEGEGGEDEISEIRALLVAVILYRRLFDYGCASPSSSTSTLLMSPPPSPTSKTALKRSGMMLALRTALGSRVFEDTEAEKQGEGEEEGELSVGLEDAKDRVVDLIVELERKERRSTTP
ncbi:hypothetical protein CVT25_009919 [Psilocybe cyanescens]|uniref:BHLH domain-containing protein n=1 Tax=Psilocybe cyanescens TaxID=93625 RepID=A0A409XCL7_PSICY|nr:hypothetical protein CVT25_009919 [Psilocybe cyanescens]